MPTNVSHPNTSEQSELPQVDISTHAAIEGSNLTAESAKISSESAQEIYSNYHRNPQSSSQDEIPEMAVTGTTLGLAGSFVAIWLLFHISAIVNGQTYRDFVYVFGVNISDPVWYEWFTSMFTHANFVHLLFNTLALLSFGGVIHKAFKSRFKYLAFFISVGLVASYVQVQAFTLAGVDTMNMPLIGASGAICGILGFYSLIHPRTEILFFIFKLRVQTAVLLFIGISIAVVGYWGVGAGGFAHIAHVTGLIIGLLVGVCHGYRPVLYTPKPFAPFSVFVKPLTYRL